MADLRVELYGELVGHLVGVDRRSFDLVAERNAIETFGLGSTILSESLPFDLIAHRGKAGRRRNFFAELLPEGTALDNLAAEIRVSSDDIIPLLTQFGRDSKPARRTADRQPHIGCTVRNATTDQRCGRARRGWLTDGYVFLRQAHAEFHAAMPPGWRSGLREDSEISTSVADIRTRSRQTPSGCLRHHA